MRTIGRAEELRLLRRAAQAAAAGAGAAVLVEGTAGLGKSFLIDAAARDTELTVLRGRAWEEGGAPPYWSWREVATAGGWVLDTGTTDPFELCASVLRRLREQAAATPLMIVLDDLHAADDDSLRLTRYVARSVSDLPLLLVAAARPSARLAGLEALRVGLRPLDDESAGQVVDLWAEAPLDDSTRGRVLAQAEGNPLHLRELARLAHVPGAMPEGLRAAVLARLGDLDAPTRELLETAAVLGRDFDLVDLARLVGADSADLVDRLDAAQAVGVVGPTRGTGWRFNHQLQRDAAYESLPRARRTALHALAAEAVGDSAARASEVARHLLDAVPVVESARAVAAARRAADQALVAGALTDAVAVLHRALPLVPTGERLTATLALAALQLDAGHVQAAHRSFDSAADLARRAGSAADLTRAALGRTARLTSDVTAGHQLPLLGEALARAEAAGHEADVVRLRSRRSILLSGLDRFGPARDDAEQATDHARRLDDAGVLAEALGALHMTCWETGREQEAAQISEELVITSERAGDDDRLLEALIARLVDALKAADRVGLDAALEAMTGLADRTGRPRHRYFADSRRAMQAFLAGRLVEGDRLSEQARLLGERIEEPDAFQVFTGSRLMVVGELTGQDELLHQAEQLEPAIMAVSPSLAFIVSRVWLAAGRTDRALASVRDVPLDAAGPLRRASALELCIRAEVVAAAGDMDYAAVLEQLLRPHAGKALVNAGAVTYCGVVDHYLGLLQACLGRADSARDDLLRARTTYTRLGATVFLSRVNAALDSVAGHAGTSRVTRTAVLRPVGDGWEAGFVGETTRLPDLRGLQHLFALLRASGHEVSASDLVSPGTAPLVAAQARDVVLDGQAKRAYRVRIGELHRLLDQVEDDEREAALRFELDALLAELRGAVGLGGRDRTLGSASERARVSVRKAVVAAIDRLAEHDAMFAHLLRSTVRTGGRCVHLADPNVPVTWLLSEPRNPRPGRTSTAGSSTT